MMDGLESASAFSIALTIYSLLRLLVFLASMGIGDIFENRYKSNVNNSLNLCMRLSFSITLGVCLDRSPDGLRITQYSSPNKRYSILLSLC